MDANDPGAVVGVARGMREAGIMLILGSVVLGLFLLIPPQRTEETAGAVPPPASTQPFPEVALSARAAIVYDLATRETLYAKNADAQLPLASLSKLLTVYAALGELGEGSSVAVGRDALRYDPPRAFRGGETFALADLARLTLTGSLNDGAATLAGAAAAHAGVAEGIMFANSAAALGLAQTYALNGNGLDESGLLSGAYGSARDVALLAGTFVERYPEIALATTRPSVSATSLAGKTYTIANTNRDLAEAPRLLLSKTGSTELAGGNLALVFDAAIEHPIAIVVLGSSKEARFADAHILIDATFARFAASALP